MLAAGALALGPGRKAFGAAPVRVKLQTALGSITVALATDAAPLTAGNFLAHVDRKLYDGASFYRVVRPEGDRNPVPVSLIQGGIDPRKSPLPPIAHETTQMTGLHHVDGTISMARYAPGTATCEFFICVGDNPAIDFGGTRNPDGLGYAAFGKVADGMDVVRAIYASDGPRVGQGPQTGQMLATPVAILDMRRV